MVNQADSIIGAELALPPCWLQDHVSGAMYLDLALDTCPSSYSGVQGDRIPSLT